MISYDILNKYESCLLIYLGANPLKFNFRAMVVTVCYMKLEKVHRISAFQNPRKKTRAGSRHQFCKWWYASPLPPHLAGLPVLKINIIISEILLTIEASKLIRRDTAHISPMKTPLLSFARSDEVSKRGIEVITQSFIISCELALTLV